MLAINKILFPTDFSECAEHAFSHAAELAAYFDAEVHVFHTRIRPLSYYPALKHLLEEAEKQQKLEYLSSGKDEETVMRAPVGEQVIVISAEKSGHSAYEEILDYSKEHDIDLIVMGTHGRRGPKRFFIGSTAERVVRRSDCPVLTLRSDADDSKVHIKNILVPVDFSDFSADAIKYASELATSWDAKITLLNVIEEAVLPTVYGVEPVSIFQVDNLLEESRKMILNLKKTHLVAHPDADAKIIVGHAAISITDFAKENDMDLIIIPTHGLTGLKRFLIGSVAEHVVRNAPCAVLAVKPYGKSLLNGTEFAKEPASA